MASTQKAAGLLAKIKQNFSTNDAGGIFWKLLLSAPVGYAVAVRVRLQEENHVRGVFSITTPCIIDN